MLTCLLNNFNLFFTLCIFAALLGGVVSPLYADYVSPKKQLEQGVLPEDIQCNKNKVLVIRDSGSTACVGEKTALKTGWKIIEDNFVVNEQEKNPSKKLHVESVHVDSTGSHSSIGRIPTPNFTMDIPTEIAVGEIVDINYTINWNDDEGNPLYPESVEKGYMEDVIIFPILHLPDEIQVLSDGFELIGAHGTSQNDHMQGVYRGVGIPYDNTQPFEGIIQIKLLESMFYKHDDMHIRLYKTDHVFSFQTVSTDEGIIIVDPSDSRSDGMKRHVGEYGRYLQMYGFDKEEQKWYKGMNEVYGINSKGFPLLTEPLSPSAVRGSNEPPQEESYIPHEGWESFAEFLRGIEATDSNFDVTEEWLRDENLSKEFIDDFFEAYPEFLIQDTDFRLSLSFSYSKITRHNNHSDIFIVW